MMMMSNASTLRALLMASAALLALSSVPETAATDKMMSSFEEWATKFERVYESVEERGKRLLIWLENHALIEYHNSRVDKSFVLGHNEYSDMTHDEFRRRMRLGEYSNGISLAKNGGGREFNFMPHQDDDDGGGESITSKGSLRGVVGGDDAVASVERRRRLDSTDEDVGRDWHAMGLIGPIRQQGQCGACWAFSAIGAIESAMAIKKYNNADVPPDGPVVSSSSRAGAGSDLGLVVPLSEQELIDCDMRFEKGCEGGLMTTTFEEEENSKVGICSEVDYPYMATEGTCSRDVCTPVSGSVVINQVDVIPRKTNALKEALRVQPVTAAMVADDPMFQFYSSGIYQMEGCGRVTKKMGDEDCGLLYDDQDVCLPDINHGVLVVGYGTDEAATTEVKGYFKVKNSWGRSWGEGGFFRIARYETDKTDPMDNWGECAILSLLSYPIME
ncbi:hypothetical protein ACHAXA_002127 [Cyclostephanos tholiformis]|uniref:Uncharacterized protein n=1 Tax=Cyclostephanos tholiformis TaxID=382380 RepID=A0ABD3RR40_9STRA